MSPGGSQDLEALLVTLPDTYEGAGKWIKVLEEESKNILLAEGDPRGTVGEGVGDEKDGGCAGGLWTGLCPKPVNLRRTADGKV